MNRWALIAGDTCIRVVEQSEMPIIPGEWVDVSGIFMGPMWVLDGDSWLPPVESNG